jgi:hypothetical protein
VTDRTLRAVFGKKLYSYANAGFADFKKLSTRFNYISRQIKSFSKKVVLKLYNTIIINLKYNITESFSSLLSFLLKKDSAFDTTFVRGQPAGLGLPRKVVLER